MNINIIIHVYVAGKNNSAESNHRSACVLTRTVELGLGLC